jgi:hypothetical protein
MAKKQIISTGRWHIAELNRLPLEPKVIWHYLISNPMSNRSGIYTIYSGWIAEGIGSDPVTKETLIPASKVREHLRLLEEIGLIKYEHVDDIVYILDYHQVVPFGAGKPSIVAGELLSEFETLSKKTKRNEIVMGFWQDYVTQNRELLIKLEEKLKRGGAKSNPDNITLKLLLDIALI